MPLEASRGVAASNYIKQELELKVRNAIFSITRIVKVIFNKMRFLAPILSLFHNKLTIAASLNDKIKPLVDHPCF